MRWGIRNRAYGWMHSLSSLSENTYISYFRASSVKFLRFEMTCWRQQEVFTPSLFSSFFPSLSFTRSITSTEISPILRPIFTSVGFSFPNASFFKFSRQVFTALKCHSASFHLLCSGTSPWTTTRSSDKVVLWNVRLSSGRSAREAVVDKTVQPNGESIYIKHCRLPWHNILISGRNSIICYQTWNHLSYQDYQMLRTHPMGRENATDL